MVNGTPGIWGVTKIKEEYPKTFEKQYKIPKYEPKEIKIEQLGNTCVYLARYRLLERYQNNS